MQQRRGGCGSKQCALVEPQAAADGGTIAMDGRQPVYVHQQAADVECVQQCAAERSVCNSVQWQQAAVSGWEQPAAQLQWKTVMAVGGGGSTKSSG